MIDISAAQQAAQFGALNESYCSLMVPSTGQGLPAKLVPFSYSILRETSLDDKHAGFYFDAGAVNVYDPSKTLLATHYKVSTMRFKFTLSFTYLFFHISPLILGLRY